MNNPKIDILLYVITYALIVLFFIKARKDYKKLTDTNIKKDLIINPRSFVWKGGIFIFAGLYMAQTSIDKGVLQLILAVSFLLLGVWNIYHAVLYHKFMKK